MDETSNLHAEFLERDLLDICEVTTCHIADHVRLCCITVVTRSVFSSVNRTCRANRLVHYTVTNIEIVSPLQNNIAKEMCHNLEHQIQKHHSICIIQLVLNPHNRNMKFHQPVLHEY